MSIQDDAQTRRQLLDTYLQDPTDEAWRSLLTEMELRARAERQRSGVYAALVALAHHHYAKNTLNVDDDADISEGEEGTWVQAWVFLPKRLLTPPAAAPAEEVALRACRSLGMPKFLQLANMATMLRTGVGKLAQPDRLLVVGWTGGIPAFTIRLPDDAEQSDRAVTLSPVTDAAFIAARRASDEGIYLAEWEVPPPASVADARDVLDAAFAALQARPEFVDKVSDILYGDNCDGYAEATFCLHTPGQESTYIALRVGESRPYG